MRPQRCRRGTGDLARPLPEQVNVVPFSAGLQVNVDVGERDNRPWVDVADGDAVLGHGLLDMLQVPLDDADHALLFHYPQSLLNGLAPVINMVQRVEQENAVKLLICVGQIFRFEILKGDFVRQSECGCICLPPGS